MLVEKITNFWNLIVTSPEMLLAVSVSAIAFTFMYYVLLKFLVKNNSSWLVFVLVMTSIVVAVIFSFIDGINGETFLIVPCAFIIVTCVLYSVEIKRAIWARTNMKLVDVKHSETGAVDHEKIQNCIGEIIKALQNMSKNDIGAIIVLSSGNVPSQIIDSGVKLDSDISSALIESVFFPKTPLHDGAMIINDTKIVAAGCFLPLSQNVDNIPKDLGTRHRAGIGVTETMDVMSIVVSEETGVISIARGGKITRYADTEMLKNVLSQYYWQEVESSRR